MLELMWQWSVSKSLLLVELDVHLQPEGGSASHCTNAVMLCLKCIANLIYTMCVWGSAKIRSLKIMFISCMHA